MASSPSCLSVERIPVRLRKKKKEIRERRKEKGERRKEKGKKEKGKRTKDKGEKGQRRKEKGRKREREKERKREREKEKKRKREREKERKREREKERKREKITGMPFQGSLVIFLLQLATGKVARTVKNFVIILPLAPLKLDLGLSKLVFDVLAVGVEFFGFFEILNSFLVHLHLCVDISPPQQTPQVRRINFESFVAIAEGFFEFALRVSNKIN